MTDFEKRRIFLVESFWKMRDFLLQGYSQNPGIDGDRRAQLGTQIKTSFKDLVTIYDKAVKEKIVRFLEKNFPGEFILGEEGSSASGQAPRDRVQNVDAFWTIDPIDGTTNFSRSYPFFCTTLAYVEKAKDGNWVPTIALTFDAVHGEMFSASLGGGAFLNAEKMRVSPVDDLQSALLTTGFASERSQHGAKSFELFQALTKQSLGVRRDGAAALDLAYVACGRIDAYWEWGLSPWDIASGVLLVQEAMGQCSRFDGTSVDLFKGEVLSSNQKLHEIIRQRIL